MVAPAGGVGAARRRAVCSRRCRPSPDAVIVNTGDDREFYGVHVSPDVDIVTYTLAGRVDPERGYGLAGDTFHVIEALGVLGHPTWFRLGDRDLATCLHRTARKLREGAGLAADHRRGAARVRVAVRILPMSEGPLPDLRAPRGGRRVHFEEYLVRDGAPVDVTGVDLGAASGDAAPACGEAIAERT